MFLLLLLLASLVGVAVATLVAVLGDGYGHRGAPRRLEDERIVR